MLHSLKYSVEFPSTGRSFRNAIQFEPGLTAITGANEAGKSMIVEMIGYCLFGKSALRGLASDYKNLSATLKMHVLGKDVTLVREPKAESFLLDGELIAVGADAVNKAVPLFLGFGLDVFNVALAAQQDELAAFTTMKPTARARMVDDLTGMDRLEATEREAKEQAKSMTSVAASLAAALTEPVEPQPPADPRTREELDAAHNVLWEEAKRLQRLMGYKKPVVPVKPKSPSITETEEQLEKYQRDRDQLLSEKNSLAQQLGSIPAPKLTVEQLSNLEAYNLYWDELRRRGPRPSHDAETLREWEKVWTTPQSGECPKCGYEFGLECITVPPLTLTQVRGEMNKAMRWSEPLEEVKYDGPDINLATERLAHSRVVEREHLSRTLDALTVPVDRADDLARVRNYNREWERYREKAATFEEEKEKYERANQELRSLDAVEGRLAQSDILRRERWSYDNDLERYEKDHARWLEISETISNKQGEADQFLNAAKALKLTRAQIKNELAPSLSAAASALLHSLTNGERSVVVIDQDFNVWVDKQPLQTLSGSGKAVVNLALRIGLGQVLTSKVLSIFIGDEIDGSMDALRAKATHFTFKNLTKHLDQVILITHKDIEADHIISL
jgi:exonuclease SbcC